VPEEAPDDDGSRLVYARALTALPVAPASIGKIKDEYMREAMRIATHARSDPSAALARLGMADARVATFLPEAIQVLLFAEATRRNETNGVASALRRELGPKIPGAIESFVRTGAPTDEIADLPLEYRAALALVRSRVADVSPKEQAELVARPKASDVLRGPVTVAIAGWTP
jgi:hypothetical protein